MSQILIARHASADYNWPGPDHERPLSSPGLVEASAMGGWLSERHSMLSSPLTILCSSATRTCQTLQGLHERAGLEATEESILPTIYEASAGELLALIQQSTEGSLLLIGHNPGVSTLVSILSAERCGMQPGSLIWLEDEHSNVSHIGETTMTICHQFRPQG